MASKNWTRKYGTGLMNWAIGFKNIILTASGNILQVKNSSGELTQLQCAVPSDTSDAATKGYVDAHEDHYTVLPAAVALTGGRLVGMTASGLNYLTPYNTETLVGVTKATVAAGADCAVSVGPVVSGFTGIVPGSIYYLGANGTITTTESICAVGVGVDSTSIRLNVQRLDGAYKLTL